ncbi:hypothetical protein HPP92_002451 [Vanilla planifolia]|uniref:Tubby-like F-box protein n=1 Tax=Vanilla planifolia TaxID=51239 RepID=A0A835S6E6_VANPL|nr:hypothetical protein HPP92_002451 [Vanilla planifolia]
MVNEEVGSKLVRLLYFVGAGVICTKGINLWREYEQKAALKAAKASVQEPSEMPGPNGNLIQCFIKRNKKNSTFYLYLGLTQTFMDKGKFLMAARRVRHGYHTEYIISFDGDDLSQRSNAYMGKLRSNFLGTNFVLYDSTPPYDGAKASSSPSIRRFGSKRVSPQVPAGNFDIGQVSYKFNLVRSRGPRRMLCALQAPAGGALPKTANTTCGSPSTIVLKNKAPRWHEHLQCWCLNFHGRVTVASVKNFQLVSAASEAQPGAEETVLLQFGKVGRDMFTMDYKQPLSAFQAFAICLTSFGTKLACE